MKTIAEAFAALDRRFDHEGDATLASMMELMEEPKVLSTVVSLGDQAGGQNNKLLRAMCLGILVGIETERQ
jgi:Flp pilus assembly protein TadB